ncbi:unnamed protein product [Echinostoma caproni]|uniref:EGF-like domain-containing protein n=1 Tax=Echinostoma caproni TaxID=27848 RepID=A0A183B8X3_9TREM|nr:unnamed protein product [Echinostoma caproni]
MLCLNSPGFGVFLPFTLFLVCCTQFTFRIVETKVERWNERVNPYERNRNSTNPNGVRQLRTNLWFRDGNQFRSTYDYRHYGPRADRNTNRGTPLQATISGNPASNVQMDAGSRDAETEREYGRGSLFWAPQGHPQDDNRKRRWDYVQELRLLDPPRSIQMSVRTEPPQPMNYIPADTYPQRMVWNEQGQFWGYATPNRDLVNDQAYGAERLMIPYDSDQAQLESDTCIPPFCIPIDCGDSDSDRRKCRPNRVTLSCTGSECDPQCPSSVKCVQNDVACLPGTFGPQCRVLNASKCWQDYSIQCAFGCTTPNDTEAPLRCVFGGVPVPKRL